MRRFVVAFILAILALPLLATSALGHERRDVGQYTFVVGWLDEPPLAGQLNAIDLTVTETSGDKPVGGVEQTLKRSEEHTSELQSRGQLVCRLLLEKKNEGTGWGRGRGLCWCRCAGSRAVSASVRTR